MLYPLPDRLHFTPAMSARALLNGLRIVEIPMRYEERVGTSKLSVLADGFRFLNAIFEGVLCYRPERLFMMVFWLFLLVGVLMALYPVEFYCTHRRVEEWMIYRFIACFLLGSMGFFLLCAAALANRMVVPGPEAARRRLVRVSPVLALVPRRPAGRSSSALIAGRLARTGVAGGRGVRDDPADHPALVADHGRRVRPDAALPGAGDGRAATAGRPLEVPERPGRTRPTRRSTPPTIPAAAGSGAL